MPLISKFRDIFKSGSSAKKKKHFHNVRLDNPEEFWEIIGELGDGAYGKVYKALHKEAKQLAALKQVALEEEEDLETFMIEIDILAECKHKNVVELLEAYHYDGKLWMYLEYCDGGAMDSIMADLYRPLTEPQIAYVCKYLVEALVYIHSQKVIHRDLKAGNVLLTMDGGVKLADFGVSAKNKNTYDKRGTFIGTPYWLAPEVILCETFIDAKYDYKADVWSLGISLIEFAQMDPPNHEISPVRVMLKIQKSDPPRLDYPSKYSKEFNDFVSKCLVKDPALRPTAPELLKHPFICKDLDSKPIRDLLLEYKADVVDEEVDDDTEDQRISRISEDEPSQESPYTVPSNPLSNLQNDRAVEENRTPTSKDKSEVVVPAIGERRKGPAPPPPVSGAPATTPTPSASSTPSRKGPAPAVPASTTPSEPSASPPPITPSSDNIGESVVMSPTISDTSKEMMTSTPSGKSPTPPPVSVSINESPVPTEEPALPVDVDIAVKETDPAPPSEEQESDQSSNVIHSSTDVTNVCVVDHTDAADKPLSKETDNSDAPMPLYISEPVIENVADVADTVLYEHTEIPVPSEFREPEVEVLPSELSNQKSEEPEEGSLSTEVMVTPTPDTQSADPYVYSVLPHIAELLSSITSSRSSGSPDQSSNEPISQEIPIMPPSAFLTPSSPEAVIASIGSDATVIVRTPTPTSQEPPTQPPVKKDSVVTYSVSEAEEQAILCLDSAIESAMDTDLSKSVQDFENDSAVTLSGSSVILSPDEEETERESVLSVDSIPKEDNNNKSESITEVHVLPNDGHKLDESEVVICNSSILHEGQQPESQSPTKPRFEVTLEETEEQEVLPPPSADDTTHISVVSVDALEEKSVSPRDESMSVSSSEVTPAPPLPKSETDHQGHLETSSNISNMSNMSGGTASTGRSESSAEDHPAVSVHIEGTTVEATDVDEDDVFNNSEHDAKSTPVTTPSEVKILSNGVTREAHRTSEKSDWDAVSTTSSEKENRHREKEDDSMEEVVLRRSHRSTSSDVSLTPLDKNRDHRHTRSKAENDLVALRKKTRKRTRKFVVDGVVVTTRQVFYEDEGTATGHLARKQELRELKILQKIEQKQFQELAVKANFAKAEQEKKFDLERQQLLRTCDTDIEALNRQQKQQVEKAECIQEVELKNASKKIRADQERELKAFRESLKTELKLLKQEVDLLPKEKRKDAFKARKERLDMDQSEREKAFLEKLHEHHEMSLKRLGDDHREKIALLERQFLQQKHQLLRSRESALWEMEERHLHEKHQLAKRQLKDIFFLQRHQMLLRHEKELEQVKRVNQRKEEELVKRQQTEKRQLPKRIRQEMKARELMFRESMRISTSHLPDSHEDEKDKIRKFQENEKRRYEAERKRAEQKHQRKLEELQSASEYTVKELEQLQNEKRKMLMEHETNKLKQQDEEYHRELREWKENLKPRKQKLEEEFEKQLNEQEQFYGPYLSRGLGSPLTPSQSSSSLARSNAS